MDVSVIRKNRRSGEKDRRQNKGDYNGPERRRGEDRRELDKRLHDMIEQEKKEKAAKKKPPSPSGNGSIIRRRKNQRDRRVS